MELLQCHKVWEIGGDELHRPPVVALSQSKYFWNPNIRIEKKKRT